jgi:hypothetical protein
MIALLDRLVSRLSRRRPPESEDARLARLAEQIAPSREELREIRAKLPPSTINYDEEGEMPY